MQHGPSILYFTVYKEHITKKTDTKGVNGVQMAKDPTRFWGRHKSDKTIYKSDKTISKKLRYKNGLKATLRTPMLKDAQLGSMVEFNEVNKEL